LLLGVFCGFISLYFTRVTTWAEGRFLELGRQWQKFLAGAATLGLLILLFPPLYGEGYDTIESLLDGRYASLMDFSPLNFAASGYMGIVIFMSLILLSKVFASSATNGGGGCGGIFAPSLFLGCIAGFVFSHTFNYFDFSTALSEKNFALLGMAGVMAGVMHAPLTGVFLIAELTGGYDLFLPLMIVSISSYVTIKTFIPHSIYSMRLAKKGELLTHHKDQAVLTLLKMDDLIEVDFIKVTPGMTLGELVKNAIAHSSRSLFPVVDKNDILIGVVLVDNIRNIMFRPELYDRFKVSRFMVSPQARIKTNMSMDEIMKIFDDTKAWNLPVVDVQGHYLGFVSKSKIFNSYRQILVDTFSGD
jgi:CIC family chloride channel protein